MLAAPPFDAIPNPHLRRNQWIPLVLSVLLHVLLILVWVGSPVSLPKSQEPAIEVELAPDPNRNEPVKPLPAESPDHSAAAKSGGTEQGAPIPQLEDGMLAQRSSAPDRHQTGTAPPTPKTDISPKPKKPEQVTQNERDFVLGQVIKHWRAPPDLTRYSKADVRVTVTVRADGYFQDAYDARRPWNPAAVFDGYDLLPPGDIQRRTVDAFLQAIRQAQPVRLPAALQAKAPFAVRLDFRFKDAR